MIKKLRTSPIPIWVNLLLVLLIAAMASQVVWFYFDNGYLLEAGITIEGEPDQNVIYTTAARLVAMIGATLFVLVTQKPAQFVPVLFMSALREAQEGVIDPLLPYANSPASPTADLLAHILIVAAEVAALVVVYRIAKRQEEGSVAAT